MAVFTATAGVNVNSLVGMAELANFDNLEPEYSPTSITVTSGDITAVFTFEIFGLYGYIRSVNVAVSEVTQWSLTGLSILWAGNPSAFTPANLLAGDDTMNGSADIDILAGFAGKDTIFGNGAADTLIGGPGKDTLNGGAARDIFDFNAAAESKGANADTIVQFSHAQGDDIDLSTIDATAGGANNRFLFAGTKTFAVFNATHNGGAVRAIMGKVEVDISGNGSVDMTILTPGVKLVAGDFVL